MPSSNRQLCQHLEEDTAAGQSGRSSRRRHAALEVITSTTTTATTTATTTTTSKPSEREPAPPGSDAGTAKLAATPAALSNVASPSPGSHHDSGSAATSTPKSGNTTILVANHSLRAAKLDVPACADSSEVLRRQNAIAHELRYQEDNPPVLPASRVHDLPPKPQMEDFLKFPEGIDERTRRAIEEKNNTIAAQHQRIDRERNNMAAKKSRATRIEALANSRRLLHQKTAECAWFRAKVLALGGSTDDWHRLPQPIKDDMVHEIELRIRAIENQQLEMKKRLESRRRSERNRLRRHHQPHLHGAEAPASASAATPAPDLASWPGDAHDGESYLDLVDADEE